MKVNWPLIKIGWGEVLHQDWRYVKVELLDAETLKHAGVLEMEWDPPPAGWYWLMVNGINKTFHSKDTDCDEEIVKALKQHGYELVGS